jgi:hypothetical protein
LEAAGFLAAKIASLKIFNVNEFFSPAGAG